MEIEYVKLNMKLIKWMIILVLHIRIIHIIMEQMELYVLIK